MVSSPMWRCSGSKLVGEEQREFSRDSPLKFLPAHLEARWGSLMTCGANSVAMPAGAVDVSFVVSVGRGM